jgi:uncharacterized membrane protein YedE/YeeE
VLTVVLELQLAGGPAGGHTAAGTAAFSHTFWWAIGFTVIGALPTLLLRRPAATE